MSLREGRFVKLPGSVLALVRPYHRWQGKLQWATYRPTGSRAPSSVTVPQVETWARDALAASLDPRAGAEPPPPRVLSAGVFAGNRSGEGWSYLSGFARPPYGLRDVPLARGVAPSREATFARVLAQFDAINALLLGPMTDENLLVLWWETTWSRAFINDWWDYLYTVWSRERGHLVVLWGTATD